MRKNHIRRRDNKPNLQLFDVEFIDLPESANVHRLFVIPMKTLYINTSATDWCNVDRVFYDINDFTDYLDMWRTWIG